MDNIFEELKYFLENAKDSEGTYEIVKAYLKNKNMLIDLLKKEIAKYRKENSNLKSEVDYYKKRVL